MKSEIYPPSTYAAIAVLVFAFFAVAYFVAGPAEDAVILYDYSKNLASKGLITYGGSHLPIEGATDFLWMIAIALLRLLRVPEYAAALGLSALGGWFLMREFSARVGILVTLVAFFATPFIYSAVQGFSTIVFSVVFVLVLKYYLEDKARPFFVAVLIMCLIRPDGVIWTLSLCVAMLYRRKSPDAIANVKLALVYLVIPGILYFCWRAFYFGEWLPLPFLVKASGQRDLAGIFFSESAIPVLSLAIPALLTAALSKRRAASWVIASIVVVPSFFYMSMRLEQNLGNRFLAPMFFGSVFVFAHVSKRTVLLFTAIVAVLSLQETARISVGALNLRQETVDNLAKQLSALNGKMAVTEAGRLAYYSDWLTDDSWGLNTPKYAKGLIREEDLKTENYDLINAHCDIDLLVTTQPNESSKNWHNMCVVLTNYIKDNGYTIYLVPNRPGERPVNKLRELIGLPIEACKLNYIFAANPHSKLYPQLLTILEANGAIRFSPTLHSHADEICTS